MVLGPFGKAVPKTAQPARKGLTALIACAGWARGAITTLKSIPCSAGWFAETGGLLTKGNL